VEIGTSKGSPINTDLSKANETTRDDHSSTNIYVEGQTIRAVTNPEDYKKDIDKAKQEIEDIGRTIKESVNDRGDDNRNFFGQLSETRLSETLENIAGERLKGARDEQEIGKALEDAYRDLGYKAKVIYTDPKNAPQLIGKDGKVLAGTAYVGKDGTHTILINTEADENGTRSGIIGTIVEEGSHIVGKVEGRQRKTGTEELGLESTGRATNQYFQDKYKDNDIPIKAKSDGKDYSSRDFGEHVGDDRGACIENGRVNIGCKGRTQKPLYMRTPEEKLRDDRVVSTVLNFIPKVGAAKIITEAVIGEDLITKEKISYLDRASSILLLSRFHLGDLNLKKVEGVKRKEPYREKPSTRIRKTPEKGRPKDIVLVEGKDGVLEAPKNGGSSKNGTSVKKVGDKNLSVTKEPTKDVTNTTKGTSVTQNQNNLTDKTFRTPDKLLENKGTSDERVSYRQSEKDLTKVLQDAYADNPNVSIEVQSSYKTNDTTEYGTKGSVRPDNGVRVTVSSESGLPESFEIKNYSVKNYDDMTSVIGKQAIQRASELPKETVQRVIIDARGQSLGKTVQEQMMKKQQVIDDIVRKSNGTIKPENVMFWE